MKGTEKQIKYAMDILDIIKLEIEEDIAKREKRIATCISAGMDKSVERLVRTKKRRELMLEAVEQLKTSDVKAGAIIEYFRFHPFNDFLDKFGCFDDDVNKLIKDMNANPFIR